MDESEAIRQRRIAELQEQLQSQMIQQNQEEQEISSKIEQLESFVKPHLTREALIRYGNIKTAFPDKAVQVLVILYQAMTKRNINRIDDEELKELLKELEPKKKEFKIKKI